MSKRIIFSVVSIASLLFVSASSLAKNVFCVHIYGYENSKCCSSRDQEGTCLTWKTCSKWGIDNDASGVAVADKKKPYHFDWHNWGPISGKKYYSICSSSHFPNTYETITKLAIKAEVKGLGTPDDYVQCTFNPPFSGTKRGGGTAEVRIRITGVTTGTCTYLYYDRSGKPNTIQGNYNGSTSLN